MSAVIRTRRTRHNPISTTALWLVLGIAVVFFLVQYGQELLLEQDLRAKAAAQRATNAALADEITRLKAALQYYGSDKYIEQRAREDLNLRRPDEEVLIPIIEASPDGGDASTDLPLPGISVDAAPAHERQNWQKWFDLFKPPGSP